MLLTTSNTEPPAKVAKKPEIVCNDFAARHKKALQDIPEEL